GANQKWRLQYDGAGYFKIVNVNSNKLMDVNSGSTADGAEIIQYTDNGGAHQRGVPIDRGGGACGDRREVHRRTRGGQGGAAVERASLNSGATLTQMTASGGNSQRCALEPTN